MTTEYEINLVGSDQSVSQLVRKANLPDDTVIVVKRDGKEVFKRYPAKRWAGITVRENEKSGPMFTKYIPFTSWSRE